MDLNPHYNNLNRTVGVCFAIGGLLFAMLQDHIAGAGGYWTSIVPLVSIVVVLILYTHLRTQFWFWSTIAALAVGQMLLVVRFNVPKIEAGAPLLIVLATLDVAVMIVCIKFVGRRVVHRKLTK